MKRHFLAALVLLLPATAVAQVRSGFSPFVPPTPLPRVTPYIGLLRGGNPAANYYLLVQPEVRREMDMRLTTPYLSSDLAPPTKARPAEDDALITIEPQSGHGAGFMMTNPYFTYPTRQRSYLPFGGRSPDPLPTPKGDRK